jgi:hypothetical protein
MDRLEGDVRRELSRFGPAGRLGDVVAAWPEAVGEVVARNAWPARISRDGTLHVHTSSSAWAFELGQLESTVLAGLSTRLGADAPPRLRFAVGPLPEPAPSAPEAGTHVPSATAEQVEKAAGWAALVEDEELRSLVARAARASLVRAASDRAF